MYNTLSDLYWWRILFVALLIGVVVVGIVLRVVFVGLRRYASREYANARRGSVPAITCDCDLPARRTVNTPQADTVETYRVFPDGSRAIYIH